MLDEIDLRYQNPEARRETFKNWPNFRGLPITVEDMVMSGFFYTSSEDKVKCFACNLNVRAALLEGDVDRIHEELSGTSCCFMKGRFSDSSEFDDATSFKRRSRKPIFIKYTTYAERLSTFTEWPVGLCQKPSDLAAAGFFSLNVGDKTQCYHCGVVLRHWLPTDEPWTEHAKWSFTCHFVYLAKGPHFLFTVTKRPYFHTKDVDTLSFKSCVLCKQRPNVMCFTNCGHVPTCAECTENIRTCPVCYSFSEKILKVYIHV